MLIKFCGIKSREALDTAMSLNADFCGFIFHANSPRFITPQEAGRLASHNIRRVGVFVKQDMQEIAEIAKIAKLDFIQLHGAYERQDARNLGSERIIRALWPMSYGNLDELLLEAEKFAGSCAWYLLDAGETGGGSGRHLDWHKLANLKLPRPWLLAGGLGKNNLTQALRLCKPDGVDINSGVEITPGVKSSEKMIQAAKAVRGEI